jgi:hypothetical protein
MDNEHGPLLGGWDSLVSTLRQSHGRHTYDELPKEESLFVVHVDWPRAGMVNGSFQRRLQCPVGSSSLVHKLNFNTDNGSFTEDYVAVSANDGELRGTSGG